ncbi:MAG: hypothetical protein HYS18_15685 [Burkholderiales bacterium]|nr:hypothetical protein [Burkholderiales bacterium]
MALSLRVLIIFALVCGCSAYAQDQATASSFAGRYPKGSIVSVEAAERALIEAQKARASENAQFHAEEQACYPKFFTTSCLEATRERHRLGLLQIRQVELEANGFKRRTRVAEREQALKERQSMPADPQSDINERILRHEAKLKKLEEEETARAAQRNSNVAAYEKKQREAEERQQELARRKREKAGNQ